jgi:SmpA / OmlA family
VARLERVLSDRAPVRLPALRFVALQNSADVMNPIRGAHSAIFHKVVALAVNESVLIMRIIPAIIVQVIVRFLHVRKTRRTKPKLPPSFRIPALGIGNLSALVAFLTAAALVLTGCDRHGSSVLSTSKITAANYDQVRLGMSKAQVESILGPPTTAETKDMVIFKKTTYRYEDGTKFILLTFKNEELDSKDGNLTTQP